MMFSLDNVLAYYIFQLVLSNDAFLPFANLFGKQVTVHVKGKTECYECQPKPAPKTYPVCTITSTPSKVWYAIESFFIPFNI